MADLVGIEENIREREPRQRTDLVGEEEVIAITPEERRALFDRIDELEAALYALLIEDPHDLLDTRPCDTCEYAHEVLGTTPGDGPSKALDGAFPPRETPLLQVRETLEKERDRASGMTGFCSGLDRAIEEIDEVRADA